ncbi:Protein SCAR3 [Abeliophyllum distichum]|uniref:Protein SCAR n=1 Tax=Abeliophyllum distichum TaxID=126358 RepID=A0ABD1QG81_9LAMI
MPLVRVEVNNEYGLGAPELYREANKEDPKEVLDGVAVAGLVGVLRQLGDLAEFAAEIFHGLQEEVMITSSRSHKLVARVQQIEAAVSPLEKAVLAQRNHIHFAYTAGSNWHARLWCEQNQFACSDIPQFIMASYEDSRSPPHLHLLDKFDPGGPGSCFKRYSDPTFFKLASAGSNEACSEKIANDKKACRIKKRRSRPRNGDVSRGSSFSNLSGRMQFVRLNVNEQTSHSQRMSTYDATLRSDFGEQSNLDSRNESGYTECVLGQSYSMQPEKQDLKESLSFQSKRYHSNSLQYNFLEEKEADLHNDIQNNLSKEQTGNSSSSITWDEKAETLQRMPRQYNQNGMAQEYDPNGNLESSSLNFDLETWRRRAVNFETADQMDVQPGSDTVPIDDVESETDQFMDALNTVESDTETDIDCTIKQEEHYFKSEDKAVDDVLVNSSHVNSSDGHNCISASLQSPSATFSSIAEVAAKDKYNSDTLEKNAHLLSTQRASELLNPGSLQSVDSHENGNIDDGVNVESVFRKVSPSNLRKDKSVMPVTYRKTSSPESQEPEPTPSIITQVKLWTNGGLLGLEPSNPPDFSVLNALPQDLVASKDGKISTFSQCNVSSSDKAAKKPDEMENSKNMGNGFNMDCSTSCQDYREGGISFRKTSWKISPSNLDVKLHQENYRSASRMFELGNLLFANESNRKGRDDNSGSSRSLNTGIIEQNNCQNIADQSLSGRSKDLFGGGSRFMSFSSSPPLEHMKVSFRPVDGFETTKLKLKFPDGNNNHGSDGFIFPSFQLVPEVSTQHNVGSYSDDDTFYRSSPSVSDDSLSHRSDSNSEQWEFRESPSSKKHHLYDALCRISLTESTSTIRENGRLRHAEIYDNHGPQLQFVENGVEKLSQSCRLFDLSSLDIRNHSFREELLKDSSTMDPMELQFAPPPLPPAQWRTMKPHLDDIENGHAVISEGLDHASDLTHSASTIYQQPKPFHLKQDYTIGTNMLVKNKQSDSQEANGRREAHQAACGKNIDRSEDFLNQIRTKSYSLRPTVTAKSTVLLGVPANGRVTAILKKANTIRQAVGSDDGGGDNWSDT